MRLLIRADASMQIGTGHIMRCLALAQAWQDAGGNVTFLMAGSSPNLEARLREEGIQVNHHPHPLGDEQDCAYTIALAKTLKVERIVVDGYQFGSVYQHNLKSAGLKVLFVDDNGHADYYTADWILNQNIYAYEGLYTHRKSDTKLLLGSRYALIRRDFWAWQGWQRQIAPIARNVLVTLGGSDPNNVTLRVIKALRQVKQPDLEVVVVVGGSNPHFSTLQAATEAGLNKLELRQNVTNMPELMAWADVAISGGGSTYWELALMKVPSLILTLADNQRAVAEALEARGVAKVLGEPSRLPLARITCELERLLSQMDLRVALSEAGKQVSDGNGAHRVAMLLANRQIWLRPVHPKDCQLLWRWANDSMVRSVSFSQAPISFEEHEQWFLRKLSSPSCYLYIAFDQQDEPVGQVRFDCLNGNSQEVAEISISLDSQFRSKGLGSLLICLGTKKLFKETSVKAIYAYIKPENIASIKSFERVGFSKESEELRNGCIALRYAKLRYSVAAEASEDPKLS